MKAVTSDGETVGWAAWAFVGFEGPTTAISAVEQETAHTASEVEKGERNHQEQEQEEETKTEKVPSAPETETQKNNTKIAALGALTNASMQEWQYKLMPPGTKCMVLVAVPVHPAYQRRGIGSSLISWGTRIADREGAFCWVHSSDGGFGAFEKSGFEEVGRLSVDLDEFAEEGVGNEEREDGRWGMYVFRYMRREAVGKREVS